MIATIRALAILAVAAGAPGVGPAHSAAAVIVAQGKGVPKAVVDVGEYGENVYDAAKAGQWAKATKLTASLQASINALTAEQRGKLTSAADSLSSAVKARNKHAALVSSNRVTYVAAGISEPYGPVVPVKVVLLDYYGRELEIWGERGDLAKLTAVAGALRTTWSDVKPAVVSAGGAAAAKKTDALIAKLDAARTAKQYLAIAKPFLDVVDELEKPFEKVK
jgi:hypothetical protein